MCASKHHEYIPDVKRGESQKGLLSVRLSFHLGKKNVSPGNSAFISFSRTVSHAFYSCKGSWNSISFSNFYSSGRKVKGRLGIEVKEVNLQYFLQLSCTSSNFFKYFEILICRFLLSGGCFISLSLSMYSPLLINGLNQFPSPQLKEVGL